MAKEKQDKKSERNRYVIGSNVVENMPSLWQTRFFDLLGAALTELEHELTPEEREGLRRKPLSGECEILTKDGKTLQSGLKNSALAFGYAYQCAIDLEEPVEIHGNNMVVEMDQHGQWHVVSRAGVPQ